MKMILFITLSASSIYATYAAFAGDNTLQRTSHQTYNGKKMYVQLTGQGYDLSLWQACTI
ncbi:MAG TPA: hypothetical protein VLA25_06195 [Methylotenera sp.]|nr:hypothetical protein [Methylotenera sp.]